MIYVTGDTHGDFSRIKDFCRRMQTTKEDILIILGDAGINYYGHVRDTVTKDRLAEFPITLFCIHGNHERRPESVRGYKEAVWHGGTVYIEDAYPNLIFAKDGEIYDLAGNKAIVIGGAYSVDKYYRLAKNYGWWPDEQPSAETKKRVEDVLGSRGWDIDIVLSHTVPVKYEPVEVFLPGIDQSLVDKTTEEWLGSVEEKLSYREWYAGHYHTKKKVGKLQIMFQNYDCICEKEPERKEVNTKC